LARGGHYGGGEGGRGVGRRGTGTWRGKAWVRIAYWGGGWHAEQASTAG